MVVERVRGEDDPPQGSVNADRPPPGRYEVIAAGGISLDSDESSGHYAKGDVVWLERDAAWALLNDGSIRGVRE